ncbi:MAG: helix-turn-helix transcriptional regulator [Candidatus Woesearchaeota archaeon]
MMRSGSLKILSLFLFIVLFSSIASAQDHYGDLDIDVTDSGLVTISGLTNADDLLVNRTSEYTSKQGKYWLLNITSDKRFSNLVFTISLPKGSSINYLKVPGFTGVSHTDQSLEISGASSNTSFEVIVQYDVDRQVPSDQSSLSLPVIIGIALLVLLIVLGILFRKRLTPKREVEADKRVGENEQKSYYLERLSERQRVIMELLEQNDGSMTQAQLEKRTGMVKSSLSRNVESLMQKGIVGKERSGMSNIVYIKKPEQ